MPCSPPWGNVSLAPVRPSEGVVPEPPIGPRIFFVIFFTQIGGKNATVRAGGLEGGQGMGQTSGNAAIYGRLANVSLAGLEVYFFVESGFGSFFRVFSLSSYSNPKNAGCGDNKRPCNCA